ncbi:NAD-dependent malic enzyme [Actinomyces sp. zg-332]|uniref:NAD-dependent malic enzyme n=1 Tax=Actinomyces sp. zg-332 TaxID=2708340 RepID=UPI0014219299|nr:NAD-dependent malic enzyme [Actinomyces sp. zg-332]QPK93904.1 NAD-dependent malic enzyme [Actinomyces sp. zg-332]
MATLPGPSHTMAIRLKMPFTRDGASKILSDIASVGAIVTGMDTVVSENGILTVDLTCDAKDTSHQTEIVDVLKKIEDVEVISAEDLTFSAHIGGKIDAQSKINVNSRRDLARAYTPGVARVCTAIAESEDKANTYTIKGNTVAVVSDGTAVLGLGNIGPKAALPVMEGKALLFKQFAGVNAWPIVLDTQDTEEIISIVKAISPGFGGINLEDISAPRCFEIESRLREELDIPVFHDDQHGTAIVVLAALINALKIVNKRIEDVRIVVSGVGAAGSAIIKLLMAQGAKDIVGYGREGALSRTQVTADTEENRAWISNNTNPRCVEGDLKSGLKDADVFIGVSSGGILSGEDIAVMADDAIVFALANPIPEVDPYEAMKHAAIVATGRSDYPNQINNVLAFPGLFRGLLDAKCNKITGEILRVASVAIAEVIPDEQLHESYIIPDVFNEKVSEKVASAVKLAATK